MKKYLNKKLSRTKLLVVLMLTLMLNFNLSLRASSGNFSEISLNESVSFNLCPALPGLGEGNSDTSKLDIQDTISSAAPHLPSVVRYANKGIQFYSEKYIYTDDCHKAVLKWLADYTNEAKLFMKAATAFFDNTDIRNLTVSQKEIYYDIKAQWLMVKHAQ